VWPLKGLQGRGVGEKVTGWDGEVLEGLEGLPGGMVREAPPFRQGRNLRPPKRRRAESGANSINNYYTSVQLVRHYLEWFGWRDSPFEAPFAAQGSRVNRVSD
jgi:hypothetical protein